MSRRCVASLYLEIFVTFLIDAALVTSAVCLTVKQMRVISVIAREVYLPKLGRVIDRYNTLEWIFPSRCNYTSGHFFP